MVILELPMKRFFAPSTIWPVTGAPLATTIRSPNLKSFFATKCSVVPSSADAGMSSASAIVKGRASEITTLAVLGAGFAAGGGATTGGGGAACGGGGCGAGGGAGGGWGGGGGFPLVPGGG